MNKKIIIIYHKAAVVTAPICAKCKGCCNHCAAFEGYFGFMGEPNPKKKFELAKTKAIFNELSGFLTNKGCGLPLEYRSIGCITYYCEKIPEGQMKMYNKIWEILKVNCLPLKPYWWRRYYDR